MKEALKGTGDIVFHHVWQNVDADLSARVKEFWATQGAIPDAAARNQRVAALVVVATDHKKNVLATATAVKMKVERLNGNWLYEYRCFVGAGSRVIGFDLHLTLESLRVLAEASSTDEDRPIGVFVVVQNDRLNRNRINKAATWRAYKMHLMGYNRDGFPIRVLYFNGARI